MTFLTRKQAAQRLNVSRDTITNLVKRGELGAIQVGSQLRIADVQLSDYVQSHKITPTATTATND
jgi:excisionase family DNA binding protein